MRRFFLAIFLVVLSSGTYAFDRNQSVAPMSFVEENVVLIADPIGTLACGRVAEGEQCVRSCDYAGVCSQLECRGGRLWPVRHCGYSGALPRCNGSPCDR